MEQIIRDYVEASLDLEKIEQLLLHKLYLKLQLPTTNVKSIYLKSWSSNSQVVQVIHIELTGSNQFKSEDVAKIKGLTIITPNKLELKVGEIDL